MSKKVDLTGRKFNMLSVVEECGSNKDGKVLWKCLCDCGNYVAVCHRQLKSGNNKSCGCLRERLATERVTKHHLKYTIEYNVWHCMKKRCLNNKNKWFKNYGGRGIEVCDRWINSVENFILDMGTRPSEKLSLDRLDNNKGYYPGNCEWRTPYEQSRNKRSNVYFEYNGKIMVITDWATELKVSASSIKYRMRIKNESFSQIAEYFLSRSTVKF